MKSLLAFILVLAVTATTFSTASATEEDSTAVKSDIFEAIRTLDYTSLNVLLSDGANINATDKEGNTPLMLAAKIGNLRILKIVLAHDPDINRQNREGSTALMIAARNGQYHVVKQLLRHKAKIKLSDRDGNTALTLASKFGQTDVVDLLKAYQASPLL